MLVSRETEKERLTDAGIHRHSMGGLEFIPAARCSLKSLEQRKCVKNCIFLNPFDKSIQIEPPWNKNEEAEAVDMKSFQDDKDLN